MLNDIDYLCGQPFNMTIIQINVPIANAEEKEVNDFCDQVQVNISGMCKQEKLCVIDNWNTKFRNVKEENVVGWYGLGQG